MSDKARPASATSMASLDMQFANFSFQAKLHETSSRIDFVYGTVTPSANLTNANFIVVAVKGSSTAAADAATATKPSNSSWSSTAFSQEPYTNLTNGHNIRATPTIAGATPLPDAGRTYTFLLPTPNNEPCSWCVPTTSYPCRPVSPLPCARLFATRAQRR